MSDFQIWLAGIVVVVVIAVIAYNRWQESTYRRRAERAFTADHPDVLFQEGQPRVEPSIGRFDDVEEGLLAPITDAPTVPQSRDAPAAPGVNAEIDSVALVLADQPILPDQFWPAIEASRRLPGNILWEGLADGLWQPISENSEDTGYRELRAGLQLASRAGPVDAATVESFNGLVGEFAQGIQARGGPGAVVQREDAAIALQRAQSVDAFCAETDIEIAVNLVGKNGATFATTKVRGLAESAGMVALASGEYSLADELGFPLFTLRNMSADEPPGIKRAGAYLTGLTFALDVPRTGHPEKTFERMMAVALQFADALSADIVDDNRKLLTANGRKVIAETIRGIAATMNARNVPPGSGAALRLYS